MFSDRHVGTYNFTTAPTYYNVFVGATEPAETHEDGWPILNRGSDDAEGFAEIVGAADAG